MHDSFPSSFDAYKRRTFHVSTSSRRWLRIKLHLLVERDTQGMHDFNTFLDEVGGKNLHVMQLLAFADAFSRTSRPSKGKEEITEDEIGTSSLMMMYLVVPFWRWRKLHKALAILHTGLGG